MRCIPALVPLALALLAALPVVAAAQETDGRTLILHDANCMIDHPFGNWEWSVETDEDGNLDVRCTNTVRPAEELRLFIVLRPDEVLNRRYIVELAGEWWARLCEDVTPVDQVPVVTRVVEPISPSWHFELRGIDSDEEPVGLFGNVGEQGSHYIIVGRSAGAEEPPYFRRFVRSFRLIDPNRLLPGAATIEGSIWDDPTQRQLGATWGVTYVASFLGLWLLVTVLNVTIFSGSPMNGPLVGFVGLMLVAIIRLHMVSSKQMPTFASENAFAIELGLAAIPMALAGVLTLTWMAKLRKQKREEIHEERVEARQRTLVIRADGSSDEYDLDGIRHAASKAARSSSGSHRVPAARASSRNRQARP